MVFKKKLTRRMRRKKQMEDAEKKVMERQKAQRENARPINPNRGVIKLWPDRGLEARFRRVYNALIPRPWERLRRDNIRWQDEVEVAHIHNEVMSRGFTFAPDFYVLPLVEKLEEMAERYDINLSPVDSPSSG